MPIALQLYSILLCFVFGLLALSLFFGIKGLIKASTFSKTISKLSFITLIVFYLQIIVGFVFYFEKSYHKLLITEQGLNKVELFVAITHLGLMLIAIFLVTLGRLNVLKAKTNVAKYLAISVFFGVALLLIAAAIPWYYDFDNSIIMEYLIPCK